MDHDDAATASHCYSLQVAATARFGDARWLPLMLTPLNDELTRIFFHQDFKKIENGAQPMPLRDRARYATAIGELSKFFAATGFHPVVVKNFLELALALFELDSGIVRHFLEPNKPGNRSPDSGDVWAIRAYIAIALDVVACDSDPRAHVSEFAKLIARKMSHLAHVVVPNPQRARKGGKARLESDRFADAMIAWRKQFLRRSVPDDRAQSSFDGRERLVLETIRDMYARSKQISSVAVATEIVEFASREAALAADPRAIGKTLPELRRRVRTEGKGK